MVIEKAKKIPLFAGELARNMQCANKGKQTETWGTRKEVGSTLWSFRELVSVT